MTGCSSGKLKARLQKDRLQTTFCTTKCNTGACVRFLPVQTRFTARYPPLFCKLDLDSRVSTWFRRLAEFRRLRFVNSTSASGRMLFRAGERQPGIPLRHLIGRR